MLAEMTEPAGLLGGVAEASWQQIPPCLVQERLRCSLAPGDETEKACVGAGWELCEGAEKLAALGDSPCQVGAQTGPRGLAGAGTEPTSRCHLLSPTWQKLLSV